MQNSNNTDDITIIEIPFGPDEIKQIEKAWKHFKEQDEKNYSKARKYNPDQLIGLADLQRKIFWRIANIIAK